MRGRAREAAREKKKGHATGRLVLITQAESTVTDARAKLSNFKNQKKNRATNEEKHNEQKYFESEMCKKINICTIFPFQHSLFTNTNKARLLLWTVCWFALLHP